MPVDHYENFPVASLLLPARLRRPIETIYAFARSADDFADEGDAAPQQRLASLAEFDAELDRIAAGAPPVLPLFEALAVTIRDHALPMQPFHDLLNAFSQDVVKTRYADFAELMDYCRRSADPIGRLLLHLYRAATPANLRCADRICSSLQIINFLQDVAIDWRKDRVYLPQEDLARFGVTTAQIAEGRVDDAWRELMRFEVVRARSLLEEGRPLGSALPGRIGLELRLIVAGGRRILDRIDAVGYDVFRRRPVLGPWDWCRMGLSALGG